MEWLPLVPYISRCDFFLPMRQLIARAGFFRQHSLTRRGVCGDARHAGLQRITLRPGGCAITAFRDGRPD